MADAREHRDPLKNFRARVTRAGVATEEQLDAIDAEVAELIDRAVAQAQAAPFPAPESALEDVYVSY